MRAKKETVRRRDRNTEKEPRMEAWRQTETHRGRQRLTLREPSLTYCSLLTASVSTGDLVGETATHQKGCYVR